MNYCCIAHSRKLWLGTSGYALPIGMKGCGGMLLCLSYFVVLGDEVKTGIIVTVVLLSYSFKLGMLVTLATCDLPNS